MTSAIAVWPFAVLVPLTAMVWWVYRDAVARSEQHEPVAFRRGGLDISSPAAWALGCLILWPLFFPLYLLSRQ